MTVRTVVAPPARLVLRSLVRARTVSWPDYSRLFAVGDAVGWSTGEDARSLEATATRVGYASGPARWARFASHQSVFLTSHFDALSPRWLASSHRLGTAYLHGRPGTPGAPEFDDAFAALRRDPSRVARIQVTHEEMHELVLTAGVAAERVFRIPLGIDLEHFPLATAETRSAARDALGLPASAFVVGSFQKDGVGWGEGFEPKLVKGPDVLVAALERLRAAAPELHVLLTGPARGYVQRELERLGIPSRHTFATSRDELAHAYHALDVYLVSSRQEGGPKAVLESLASGVPLVSTRVGQASDVVRDGESGLLVDVEDAEALAAAADRLRSHPELCATLRGAGRETAERYAHERLDPLWSELLEGFVSREG
jgi:glycosyltransferase involved in cell wall biosynthesis